nr:coiled coil helix coiled coil helix [Hymenolepis microstoma]
MVSTAFFEMSGHDFKPVVSKADDDEEDDPVIASIKRTGCLEHHNAVMECMYENRDWRKCQKEVDFFRMCMSKKDKKPK